MFMTEKMFITIGHFFLVIVLAITQVKIKNMACSIESLRKKNGRNKNPR